MKDRVALLVVSVIIFGQGSRASADTFVFPHVLERSGTIANTPYTFDTTMFMTYSSTAIGGGASVDTYLFDQATGAPMRVGSTDVCNPCTNDLTVAQSSAWLRVDDCIVAAGGYASEHGVKLGFGVVVVGGQDPDGVNVQGFVVNSHTSPFDLSVFGFEPQPLQAASAIGQPPPPPRTRVLPHVLETAGKTVLAGNDADTGGSTDTLLFPVYTGGLFGRPDLSATLCIELFNADGSPMTGAGGPIAPYELTLNSANRSPLVSLEDLINSAGGFGGLAKEGYARLTVTGDSPSVNLSAFIVRSGDGPYDLYLTSVVPEPSALVLCALGGLAVAWCTRYRRRRTLLTQSTGEP